MHVFKNLKYTRSNTSNDMHIVKLYKNQRSISKNNMHAMKLIKLIKIKISKYQEHMNTFNHRFTIRIIIDDLVFLRALKKSSKPKSN